MLVAPTGSGKTEAVVAPLIEKMFAKRWEGLSIVYIAPTRALVNDLFQRLDEPFRDVGLKLAAHHGDRSTLPTSGSADCLITTPESLDSLLCRRREIFGRLRAVVLDEVHLVDQTYRGDQLRILLRRLRRVADTCEAVHALSATVGRPREVGRRYLGSHRLVSIGSVRVIEMNCVDSLESALGLLRSNGRRKALVFFNRRSSVEEAVTALRRRMGHYPVVLHHGQLSRSVRQEAEQVLKESPVAVCCCTSTLEVGIDVGDIDAVVLAEVPWSLSSFIQRVGRANRRGDKAFAIGVCASELEREWFMQMAEAALACMTDARPYQPDLSVCVQQSLSFLFENRRVVTISELESLLSPLAGLGQVRRILAALESHGLVRLIGNDVALTEKGMNLAESGVVHSNIPDSSTYRVVDVTTGRTVGRIGREFDRHFLLAGRGWSVVRVIGDLVEVRPASKKIALSARFEACRSRGRFEYLLPRDLV